MMKKSSLKLALLLSLAAGVNAYGALGAEVPLANTDIGNQAYVSYLTEAGTQKFLQSNIVITRVNSVYNLALTPNRTATITRGSFAIFNHTLVNTGNIKDSYDLRHDYGSRPIEVYLDKNSNGIIDPTETKLTPDANGKYSILDLDPGDRVSLLVSIKTEITDPIGGLTGNIFAKSKGNIDLAEVSVSETVVFQTGGNAIVYKALSKASGTSERREEISVFLKIANDDLVETNIAGNFKLTDKLDPRFKYVAGSAKWKNYNGIDTVLSDADDSETDSQNSQPIKFKVVDNELTFELPQGIPGNKQLSSPNGYLEFKIAVPENTLVGTIPNEVKYDFNPTGGDPVVGRTSNKVNYEVLKYVRATFTGMHIPVGQAGETLRFVNKFVNTANSAERYSLKLSDEFFPAGTTFRMAMESYDGEVYSERPILDTNGDGNVDTGLVDPGEEGSVNVILYATLPTNMPNPGSDYKIVKNATSIFKPDYAVRANDTLGTIKVSTVDITNDFSVNEKPDNAPGIGLGPERNPVTQISLNPGTVGNFVLHVNNTSQYIEEQYSLEVSTKSDFSDMILPSGVVVKFKQGGGAEVTKTAKIAPNQSQRIDAEVTVSSTASAAVVPLYFRVTSLTTGSRDIKYDSLNINPIRSVQIVPNLTGETYAGGNIVYTHKVRNNGNVLEGDGRSSSLNLAVKESLAQWRTETFLDVNKNGIFETGIDIPFVDFATIGGLKAGEEVTIFARVFAPLGAPSGVTNDTTITPNLTQGTYSTVPTVTSALDKTRVLAEKLIIGKFQKLTEAEVWKTGIQNANPGDKIFYKIDVRNSGTDEARNIQLKDNVPFYTTIVYGVEGVGVPRWEVKNSSGLQTSSGQIINPPANGTRGELVVDLPTLEAGSTLSMYFHVKINKESASN
ncbi:COG1470 family protein [Cetobacterium sp.]|uniref:COG1470 family protein n=1 Tax=Cetobacterium sp. TaxID=2071632 RepID=UPI003F35D62C